MILRSYERIYNKNLRFKHHNENFKERILRDITVIPIIGNREKHYGKHRKYPKKQGEHYVKHGGM